jgi:hypothetical protein
MFNTESVRQRIEAVAISEGELAASVAKDVAFHMTDWLNDLSNYVKFCQAPATHTDEQVDSLLLALLQHAPNHLAAAAKLYADYPVKDIFDVGAVESRDE